jgi:FkbM family methyltransferase
MSTISRLIRHLTTALRKPRHWLLRPNTIDARVFREVVVGNEYRLPRHFRAQDVILDIGGHIGSFAYACCSRGAGAVYCCEANPSNVEVLRQNLAPYADRVSIRHTAVWRSDQPAKTLYFEHLGRLDNTGSGRVTEATTDQSVAALPFDDLVMDASNGGRRRIRLAKLDCEGAEWPILLTSRLLQRIDALCGEYHLGEFPAPDALIDLPQPTPALLSKFLEERGFAVETCPCPKEPRLGLFFAQNRMAAAQAA